jgi:hypothetical protein
LFDQVRHGKVFFPGKGDNPFAISMSMTRRVPSSMPLEAIGRGSGWWPMRYPVPGTTRQTIGVEPKFATIHQGIPFVLDDSISFYWLPSNLDRL